MNADIASRFGGPTLPDNAFSGRSDRLLPHIFLLSKHAPQLAASTSPPVSAAVLSLDSGGDRWKRFLSSVAPPHQDQTQARPFPNDLRWRWT